MTAKKRNHPGPASNWNDERIDQLKTLWAQGLSARLIAQEMGGVSRNGIVGKIHRLNLDARETKVRSKTVRRHVATIGLRAANPVTPSYEPLSLRIPFAKSGDRQCRFIAGDPVTDSSICGHETPIGKPYCSFHLGVTFTPATNIKRITDAI